MELEASRSGRPNDNVSLADANADELEVLLSRRSSPRVASTPSNNLAFLMNAAVALAGQNYGSGMAAEDGQRRRTVTLESERQEYSGLRSEHEPSATRAEVVPNME